MKNSQSSILNPPPPASLPSLPSVKSEFSLVLEFRRPIAAIIPRPITPDQRDTIYALLPSGATLSFTLSQRWKVWAVLCTDAWASEQLKRVPMTQPKKSIKLTFAS